MDKVSVKNSAELDDDRLRDASANQGNPLQHIRPGRNHCHPEFGQNRS
jgi:hypothetical protein